MIPAFRLERHKFTEFGGEGVVGGGGKLGDCGDRQALRCPNEGNGEKVEALGRACKRVGGKKKKKKPKKKKKGGVWWDPNTITLQGTKEKVHSTRGNFGRLIQPLAWLRRDMGEDRDHFSEKRKGFQTGGKGSKVAVGKEKIPGAGKTGGNWGGKKYFAHSEKKKKKVVPMPKKKKEAVQARRLPVHVGDDLPKKGKEATYRKSVVQKLDESTKKGKKKPPGRERKSITSDRRKHGGKKGGDQKRKNWPHDRKVARRTRKQEENGVVQRRG